MAETTQTCCLLPGNFYEVSVLSAFEFPESLMSAIALVT